jgi:hypothetical protein
MLIRILLDKYEARELRRASINVSVLVGELDADLVVPNTFFANGLLRSKTKPLLCPGGLSMLGRRLVVGSGYTIRFYASSGSGGSATDQANATSATTLSSLLIPSKSGTSITFTDTTTPLTAKGAVTFKDGRTTLGAGSRF